MILVWFAVWNTIHALRFLLADLYYGRGSALALAGQNMRESAEPGPWFSVFKRVVVTAISDLKTAHSLNPDEPAYQVPAEGPADLATLLGMVSTVIGPPAKDKLLEEAAAICLEWMKKTTHPERTIRLLEQILEK